MTAPDEPQHSRSDHEAAGQPAGSLAEEAAMLVDLLSHRGWPGSSRMPSGEPGAPSGPGGATADTPGQTARDAPGTGECTCGGTTPAACRVCPVCQVIAFVQKVDPDAIERMADLVGFAATALHDLATAQRERRSAKGETGETGETRPGGRE